jgi:hypothetical protein
MNLAVLILAWGFGWPPPVFGTMLHGLSAGVVHLIALRPLSGRCKGLSCF